MIEGLRTVFSLVCGQYADHVWVPGQCPLPCCQRCTGLYAGAFLAVLCQFVFRPRPTYAFRLWHGLFLLLMVPFGFHWLSQGPVLRCETGILFGFGVVAFLWLVPGAKWQTQAPPRTAGYSFGLLASLVSIPVTALWGGRPGGFLLSWLAALGLFALGVLVLINLGLALTGLLSLRRGIGENLSA